MSQQPGICPVCKKPLLKGEDIVTCPSCGAQYHRACYEQTGDCLFRAQHGPDFEYRPATAEKGEARQAKNEGGILCHRCQTVNDAQNIFCENCGAPLHKAASAFSNQAEEPPPPPGYPGGARGFSVSFGPGYGSQRQYTGTIDGIPANDWAKFIGNSAPVYLSRLAVMERSKYKVSFMFSAFFVSPAYFAFRKMWGWAIASLALTLLLLVPQIGFIGLTYGQPLPIDLSLETWDTLRIIASYITISMKLFFGMFGLYLYKGFAAKKIRALREEAESDANYEELLVQKGGTSNPGVLLVVAVYILFQIATSFLIGDALMAYVVAMNPGLLQ